MLHTKEENMKTKVVEKTKTTTMLKGNKEADLETEQKRTFNGWTRTRTTVKARPRIATIDTITRKFCANRRDDTHNSVNDAHAQDVSMFMQDD